MKNWLTDSRNAAMLGVLLPLPIAFVFVVAVLNIEPVNGFLKIFFGGGDGVRMKLTGLVILLTFLLGVPVALVINIGAIRRSVREGLKVRPLNFSIAVSLLTVVLALTASFVVDQYPCWMGVPNCD